MKKTIILLLLIASTVGSYAQCCKKTASTQLSETNVLESSASTNDVKAYYFHATRRCDTCIAVEKVSQEAITEYYGKQVEYISLNSEDAANEKLVKQFKVAGPALLIVKGSQVIDLTTDAFLNAESKPEKLKARIKSSIDPLI